jgi:hypothetical protein
MRSCVLVLVVLALAFAGPSVVAGPATPPATPDATAYPPLDEPRDIWVRPWALTDRPFSIMAEIESIRVAREGYGFTVGDDDAYRDTYRTMIGARISLANGDAEQMLIMIDADVPDVYEGDVITTGGVLVGTETLKNMLGGDVTVPLFVADYVTPESATPTP